MDIKKTIRIFFIIMLCILVNVAFRNFAAWLKLPVWLDVIGTCLSAYYTGIVGGVLTAICSSIIYTFSDSLAIYYIFISVIIGICFAIISHKKYLDYYIKAMVASFFIGILSVAISTPINMIINTGKSGNIWGDAFFDMLQWYNVPKYLCALGDEIIVEIIDKQVSVTIVIIIVSIINNIFARFQDAKSNKKTISAVLVLSLLSISLFSHSTFANDVDVNETNENKIQDDLAFYDDVFIGNYHDIKFDSSTGMQSSEANVIAETPDGYIWIGSYAGLTRYDGSEFEFITEGGISNVTAMVTDSEGTLWIGTNDKGVVRYKDGDFKNISTEEGLSDKSIRSLVVDEKNECLYVGTSDKMSIIYKNLEIEKLDEINISYVCSMTIYDDMIWCVDNSGKLSVIKDKAIIGSTDSKNSNASFTCAAAKEGLLYIGTSGGYIQKLNIQKDKLIFDKQISTGELEFVNSINFDKEGRIWICADNGFGYLTENYEIQSHSYNEFEGAIESMHEDYEGNLWLASSRYGVLKLSKNNFTDLFAMVGIERRVVNAIENYNGYYYCGTDTGLVIIDPRTNKSIENKLTKFIGDKRIRACFVDNSDNLWICTYSELGLIMVEKDGSFTNFNTQNSDTTSDRFRCGAYLSDKTVVVGTNDGINFFKDGKLTKKLTTKDGLLTSQILCLYVDADDTIYAGSDGSGIYVIKNEKIVDCLSADNGFKSDVILRISPDNEGGYFVVTSNSLYYMKDNNAIPLTSFPYFNNYDVITFGDKTYVLSSNGVYIVDTQMLRDNDENLVYKHYNSSDGITGSFTVNSWNYVSKDGTMYLCCNNGVMRFVIDNFSDMTEKKFDLVSVIGDGKLVKPEKGCYVLDSDVSRIIIKASVRSYSLSKVKVKFFIDGIDNNPVAVLQNELEPIQITNLRNGNYTIHLQLLSDDESSILAEKEFHLKKTAQMWENPWYLLYLFVVLLWLTISISVTVLFIMDMAKSNKKLEIRSEELSNKVEQQTAAILEQAKKMQEFEWSVIESMASLIEGRDGNTGEHVINTRYYVSLLVKEMYKRSMFPEQIDEKFVGNIILAAPLHDVGKIKISDTILNKPGKYTPNEYEEMKKHSSYGGEIIGSILGKDADEKLVSVAKDVAMYHHEKWNGQGYPEGRKGTDIPLAARIMAVADVFDALVSKRVYKDAMSYEKAFDIIKKDSGSHFDPDVAKVFLSLKDVIFENEKELSSTD